MKTTILMILLLMQQLFAQNITNTLGTSGIFSIKDAANTLLTLSQTNKTLDINGNIRLPLYSTLNTGIIYKGTYPFIHNYNLPGTVGHNTFIGLNTGGTTLSGTGSEASNNTAMGEASMNSLTSGCCNTSLGSWSLNNVTSGKYNNAFGYNSLYQNTTASFNCAFGAGSMENNLTGNNNCSYGVSSMSENTTGYDNCAFGRSSLLFNISGYYNTGVGSSSLRSNVYGYENSGLGYNSLKSNTDGYRNVAIGVDAMSSNTIGSGNTGIGAYTLTSITTGNLNTVIGYQSGTNIITGSNNTVLGYNTEPSSTSISNQITLGNSSVTSLRCNVTSITSLSDARDKKNIKELSLGLDFIAKLKPRQFNWDKREWYDSNVSDGSKMQQVPTAGFIAQELDSLQQTENAEWLNLVLKDNPEKLEATTGNLLPIMVKAIQELKAENDALKSENSTLRIEISALKLMDDKINAINKELQNLKIISIENKSE